MKQRKWTVDEKLAIVMSSGAKLNYTLQLTAATLSFNLIIPEPN